MNEWANWVSRPVHLGGGATTSPGWTGVCQTGYTVTLDQNGKPWLQILLGPMVQCGAQEVIKVNRAQVPTAWVSSSQEMEMGFATPPSSWALTSTTWSRDGHPGPATTPHLPEHPDTPEGQTWGLQTGHKGPLYPHHHSGFRAEFRLQIPNTSGWEEGQAGVLRWQWLSRRDLLYTSAQD